MIYQIFLFIFILGQGNAASNFTYNSQSLWGDSYPRCNGIFQSPIAIRSGNTIPKKFPELKFFRYRQPLSRPLLLESKSDSVAVSTTNRLNLPYVRGGPFRGTYEFDSFHFHWGRWNNVGSEHVLNGKRFPLELHIVHKNTKYRTLTQAANNIDGLMVFGILFKVSRMDNIELAPILYAIRTGNITTETPVYLEADVSLRRIFGRVRRSKYFFYPGHICSAHQSPAYNFATHYIKHYKGNSTWMGDHFMNGANLYNGPPSKYCCLYSP